MAKREATCCCGQLRVVCDRDPVLVTLCHCFECQKRTGSAFGIAAFFVDEAVAISGASTEFERQSDSGHAVMHHFCPDCGSTVYWKAHRKPGLTAVAVGTFSDPSFPPPTQAVYATDHRHPWVNLPF